jgi:methionyl aminopeptidase
MAIILKTRREIDLMRDAGRIVGDVLLKLKELARPGVTTAELDEIATKMAHSAGAETLFKGVKSPYASRPFPGAICASVNEQIVHGIPSSKVVLKDGDIISVDFGVRLKGYCGDAAVTIAVGNIDRKRQQLMDVTSGTLDIAIENARPGIKWSEVAGKMQAHAESAGFSVVRDFVGHGIGHEMHEDPKVPNFVNRELLQNDIMLVEGMVLAVEPMVNMGSRATRTLRDGWTVVTRDGKCSAHFEHSIAIVADGCKVLTRAS